MQKRRYSKRIAWCFPLIVYSVDANAWGLYTHVFFAQYLLISTPLLDQRFRSIIFKFPELVMAGACIPDLAVICKQFSTTHRWQKAEQLIQSANSEETLALAIGYASHLYVDVIAHNHFVPAHEALWLNETIFTHIASEWAMDAHVSRRIHLPPWRLLKHHAEIISQFIAPVFGQPAATVLKQVKRLSLSDRLLRSTKLPQLIYRCIQLRNKHKHFHFHYYINHTLQALNEFHKSIAGIHPDWEPELATNLQVTLLADMRQRCLEQLNQSHELPINYYT